MNTQLKIGILIVLIIVSISFGCKSGVVVAVFSALLLIPKRTPVTMTFHDDTDNVLPLVSKLASTPFVKNIMEDCKTDKSERGFYAAIPKDTNRPEFLHTEDTTLEKSECFITSMASYAGKNKDYMLIHIHTHPDECYEKHSQSRPKYPCLPSNTDLEFDLIDTISEMTQEQIDNVQYINMIISSNCVMIYQYTKDFIQQFTDEDDDAMIYQGDNWSDFINEFINDAAKAVLQKPEKVRTVLSSTYPELGITAPVAYCQFYEISEIPETDSRWFHDKNILWEFDGLGDFLDYCDDRYKK